MIYTHLLPHPQENGKPGVVIPQIKCIDGHKDQTKPSEPLIPHATPEDITALKEMLPTDMCSVSQWPNEHERAQAQAFLRENRAQAGHIHRFHPTDEGILNTLRQTTKAGYLQPNIGLFIKQPSKYTDLVTYYRVKKISLIEPEIAPATLLLVCMPKRTGAFSFPINQLSDDNADLLLVIPEL